MLLKSCTQRPTWNARLQLNGDVYKAEAVATIKGWKTTAVYGKGTNTNDPAVLKTLKMNISIANLEDQLTHSGPVSVSIDATPTDFYCALTAAP